MRTVGWRVPERPRRREGAQGKLWLFYCFVHDLKASVPEGFPSMR